MNSDKLEPISNPPYSPYQVSELCFVNSLKNWTNTKVKVLGRIKFLSCDITENILPNEEISDCEDDNFNASVQFEVKNIYSKLLTGETSKIFESPINKNSAEEDNSELPTPLHKTVNECELEHSINWNNTSFYNDSEHNKTVDLEILKEDDTTNALAVYNEAIFKDGAYSNAYLYSVGEKDSISKIKVRKLSILIC